MATYLRLAPNGLEQDNPTMIASTLLVRWIPLIGIFLGLTFSVRTEEPEEHILFNAALRAFNSGSFNRASSAFTEFTNRFPASTLKPSAERRALFARGEAQLEQNETTLAAATFAAFQRTFPTGELSADAALREALIWLRVADPTRATAVLERSSGSFQQALAAGQPVEILFAGLSLTAEAHLALKDYEGARKAILAATAFAHSPAERWNRTRLELRIIESTTNRDSLVSTARTLRALANDPSITNRRPESVSLLGRILFESNQPEEAILVLEGNLGTAIPPAWRTDSLERVADWWIQRGELARARVQLEKGLDASQDDPSTGTTRLRLAQVFLRQHQSLAETNRTTPAGLALLSAAAEQLDRAFTNSPPASLLGTLHLTRGWGWWTEGMATGSRSALTNALLSFSNAVTRLQPGTEREKARFKFADTAAALGDSATALKAFIAVTETASTNAVIRAELLAAALEQTLVAAVAATNASAGEKAFRQLLVLPGTVLSAGRGALMLGGTLVRRGSTELGRALFTDFLNRFTNSPVRPEIELELAAIALHEERWTNAITDLRLWIGAHTNHASTARAGFHLAYALARSGKAAAAMEQFVKLASQHPDDPDALTAQLWLAGNFFGQQDYLRAGQACAVILTNATARSSESSAWFRAKLWSAEAGRKLQNYDSASDHFRELLNDKSTPPDIRAAAYYHYGEMLLEKPQVATAEPLTSFKLALEAFSRVPEFTNSPYATAALCMMANCHLQLASLNPANYARAAQLYQTVAQNQTSTVLTRTQAWLGYAEVTRKQAETRSGSESLALTARAISLFEDVAYGRLLRSGETLPPASLAEATRSAGELLERSGRLLQAAGLYENAALELPAAAPVWTQRARRLRESLAERAP